MFTVVYRWRIKPEKEATFCNVWRRRTEKIHAVCGSYGARLHRESDGSYFSIALWPSRALWESDVNLPDDAQDARLFRESILETLPVIAGDVIDDAWQQHAVE